MCEHTLKTYWSSLEEPCKTTYITKRGYQEATRNGILSKHREFVQLYLQKRNISVIYSLEKGSTPTEEGANDTRVKPATQCEGATAFPQHGKVLL